MCLKPSSTYQVEHLRSLLKIAGAYPGPTQIARAYPGPTLAAAAAVTALAMFAFWRMKATLGERKKQSQDENG